ncbi:MAG: hypothetical protein ACJA2D_001644 [Pseudohongiellaceae bacterium]|jgi:hypothetical protein
MHKSDGEYQDYIDRLYKEFPTLLTWPHSITGERLRAGFCVPASWLPHIKHLLENIRMLDNMHSIEPPIFRDFKEKRGYLSVHYDGGCQLAERLVDILETNIDR